MHWVGIGLATISVLLLTLISIASSYFLLKARNKYKNNVVRDIADLGEISYGPPMRYFCQFILVLGQISLLVAYLIYLGEQSSQIATQLGHKETSTPLCAFVCIVIMTPAYLQKEYQTLAYFSSVFTACSFVAILIIWTFDCIEIHNAASRQEVPWFDFTLLPLFLGQTAVLYEGNCSLLNIYAETREPRQMMQITVQVHVFLSTAVLITGVLSCYAFGDSISEIILYDLPEGEAFTVLTQGFYMLNIMGTFVMMA